MTTLRYISHPEVVVDPDNPVDEWDLSDVGHRRLAGMLGQPWIPSIRRIVSSGERKAKTTANVLSEHLGLTVEVRPGTGENDRSATGFVRPDRFEALADAFFSQPDNSVEGWERAVDAQSRIVNALSDLWLAPQPTDVAVVGHGAVGTLLYCHLAGLDISRRFDQPTQGHYFSIDLETVSALHPWQGIDRI